MLLPVDFPYWAFALLIAAERHRHRACSRAPNTSAIMSSVPGRAARRGLGHALDVPELRHGAVDRRVLLADDRRPGQHACRDTLTSGLHAAGRAARRRRTRSASLPPVGSLFAAFLGYNPIQTCSARPACWTRCRAARRGRR